MSDSIKDYLELKLSRALGNYVSNGYRFTYYLHYEVQDEQDLSGELAVLQSLSKKEDETREIIREPFYKLTSKLAIDDFLADLLSRFLMGHKKWSRKKKVRE